MSDANPSPKSSTPRKIGVLLSNQRYSDTPHVFVDEKTLDYWWDCEWVRRIGRHKYQLTKAAPLKLHDISSSFGAKAMHALACGSAHHKALLEAAWL